MSQEKPGWKTIPWGGLILEAGNSENYKTGGWRSFRPVWDKEKCSQCMRCWALCPDGSILVEDGKIVAFDFGISVSRTGKYLKSIPRSNRTRFSILQLW